MAVHERIAAVTALIRIADRTRHPLHIDASGTSLPVRAALGKEIRAAKMAIGLYEVVLHPPAGLAADLRAATGPQPTGPPRQRPLLACTGRGVAVTANVVGQTLLRVVSRRRRDHAKVAEVRLLRVGASIGRTAVDRQTAAASLVAGKAGILVAEVVGLWNGLSPAARLTLQAGRPIRGRQGRNASATRVNVGLYSHGQSSAVRPARPRTSSGIADLRDRRPPIDPGADLPTSQGPAPSMAITRVAVRRPENSAAIAYPP